MKTALAAVTALLIVAGYSAAAQAQASPAQRMQPASQPQQQTAPPAGDLNAILSQVQQATSSTNVNIGKLRIERWKTDVEQKQQLQQIAESLQKNIANALPGMVTDVQSSHGSVATSFKLYHNLNVLYENLNYLADVAGSLGKKEEFEPLAADCASLESARKNLSIYIEQAAVRLENASRMPNPTTQARQAPGTPVDGKKVIVINEDDPPAKKAVKPTKKKTSPPSASSAPATAQSAGTPH